MQTTTHSGAVRETTADLQAVLAAWEEATTRLAQTHAALQAEVRRLTDELEFKNRELARKNRLANLGQIAAHVAHEVRNNLVPVKLYLSLLKRLCDDAQALDVLAKVSAALVALDTTVDDLLSFTAERDPTLKECSLKHLVDEVLTALAPQLAAQGVRTDVDIAETATILADWDLLRRAVLNLALNALDAMPQGGDLVVTAYLGGTHAELEVADSGPGLNEEALRRAFEPFYSTKRHGTGLGLAAVYRVADVHGGSVSVRNCPEGGAAFTLRLPRRALEKAA